MRATPPQVDLAALVQTSPQTVFNYADSPAFPAYMESGNRVRALVEAVQRSHNEALMAHIIQRDTRDKMHSVAYMKAFRQALRENDSNMALAILNSVKYPLDLLADILQTDGNSTDVLRAGTTRIAYLEVMREFEQREESFFNDFCAYMVLTYTSENDLLSNLMAADKPGLLPYVADLDSDFGVRVFKAYVSWKYDDRENLIEDQYRLIEVVGRFSSERRADVVDFLDSVDGIPEDVFQAMLQDRGSWQRIQEAEPARNAALRACREAIDEAESRGIHTKEDVDKLVDEIERLRETGATARSVVTFVSIVVEGRYRYL